MVAMYMLSTHLEVLLHVKNVVRKLQFWMETKISHYEIMIKISSPMSPRLMRPRRLCY